MTEEGRAATAGQRQFSAEGTLPSGDAIEATIVAAPSEEGRAKVALSNAISRAQQFYGEILNPGGVASQIDSLKKGEALSLSPTAFDFIEKARILAPQTDGFFDITAPSPKHVFIKSDWRRIALDPENRTITLKSDDMKLDLRRIALGYACDLMMDAIRSDGFADASVKVGPTRVRTAPTATASPT
jgi:thiamine biosynthesis lipoprotein ApbE